MALCQSGLISSLLILAFACAAMTASSSQCSLILHALDSVVKVCSGCSTTYISLMLMYLALCLCGTVVLTSWAGVCILDSVSTGQRK